MAQNINDFYIQLGKRSRNKNIESIVEKLNASLSQTNIGRAVSFIGSGSKDSINSTLVDNILRRGSIFAIDPNQKNSAFSRNSRGSYSNKLSANQLEQLKKEKIKKIPKLGKPTSLSEGIYLNTNNLMRSDFVSAMKTVYHEMGHAASYASGAAQESINLRTDSLNKLKDSSKLTFGEIKDLTTDIMRAHAHEEGRAEQFAIETLQKRQLASGKVSSESIVKRMHLSYMDPSNYDKYLSHYSDTIKGALSRMEGYNPSDLSKLLEDVNSSAKASAIGSMHGHFRMISGDFGPLVKEKADSHLSNFLDKIADPQKGAHFAEIIQKESDEIVKSGRRVVLGEPLQGAITSQTSGTLLAAAEDAMPKVARSVRSETDNLLKAASRAAEAVVKKDSAGMRLAGAAATILRKRAI